MLHTPDGDACQWVRRLKGNRNPSVTIGQQLIDLQKAKESGAITGEEFQDQKAKLLGTK